MLLYLILVLMMQILDANPGNCGNITIKEDGKDVTRFAITGNPPWCWTNDSSSITLLHNAQVQIANRPIQPSPNNTYYPDMYVEYKLNGKTVSYTVDLSEISCSCNANLFFNSMPGYYANGKPDPGQHGHYYCDANDGNKEWCWEMDIMEANKFVTATTAHQCSQNPGTHITSCDRGGCQTNSHNVDGNSMGPGSQYKIDTTKPFTYAINFGSMYQVTLTQGTSKFQYQPCNQANYRNNMKKALDYGMVIVMSYWGGSYTEMSWLDGMTGCKGNCDGSGTLKISDITIS
eukprot:133768_1